MAISYVMAASFLISFRLSPFPSCGYPPSRCRASLSLSPWPFLPGSPPPPYQRSSPHLICSTALFSSLSKRSHRFLSSSPNHPVFFSLPLSSVQSRRHSARHDPSSTRAASRASSPPKCRVENCRGSSLHHHFFFGTPFSGPGPGCFLTSPALYPPLRQFRCGGFFLPSPRSRFPFLSFS